ncbi:hypothetical protein BDF19DRAFT_451875 [Syncephalis fuscata]|nr:hypothetical protein BDF19DRAFT_451875 [Syncephalis fuscata]
MKPGPGFGAYSALTYSTFGFSCYEGAPPVDMALLPYDNYMTVVDASHGLNTTVIVTVKEEAGPWNDVFLSAGYKVFIYCTLAVFISIILYSFLILYRLIKTKRTITRRHIVIYVSALLCASSLTLKLSSLAYEWVVFSQGFFMHIGFYLLLLLWHSLAINVQDSRYLLQFRYAIIISFAVATINQLLRVIYAFIPTSVTYNTIRMVAALLVAPFQIIVIVAFTYYGIAFWLKQGDLLADSTAKYTLLLVTKICAIFTLGFLMVFTGNMMENQDAWRYGVKVELICVILLKLSFVVRISVLLFVIDLRPKSDSWCNNRVAIGIGNKKDTTTSVQRLNNRSTNYADAIMSSNIDPDAQSILRDSTYYNTTTTYN